MWRQQGGPVRASLPTEGLLSLLSLVGEQGSMFIHLVKRESVSFTNSLVGESGFWFDSVISFWVKALKI